MELSGAASHASVDCLSSSLVAVRLEGAVKGPRGVNDILLASLEAGFLAYRSDLELVDNVVGQAGDVYGRGGVVAVGGAGPVWVPVCVAGLLVPVLVAAEAGVVGVAPGEGDGAVSGTAGCQVLGRGQRPPCYGEDLN